MKGAGAASRIIQYDAEVRRKVCRRRYSNCGVKTELDDELEKEIIDTFNEDDTP